MLFYLKNIYYFCGMRKIKFNLAEKTEYGNAGGNHIVMLPSINNTNDDLWENAPNGKLELNSIKGLDDFTFGEYYVEISKIDYKETEITLSKFLKHISSKTNRSHEFINDFTCHIIVVGDKLFYYETYQDYLENGASFLFCWDLTLPFSEQDIKCKLLLDPKYNNQTEEEYIKEHGVNSIHEIIEKNMKLFNKLRGRH